jgi:effector-binding domain-containing protein
MEQVHPYEVRVARQPPQLIAAVQAQVLPGGVSAAFRESLDKVWAFLRQHPGLRASDGHNLFLYRHNSSDTRMTVEFGVQVTRHFEAAGDVRCVATPAGETAFSVHRGPYQWIPRAHEAVKAWTVQNQREMGDWSWELYGDHNDDPQQLQTTVYYLLR